MAVQRKKPYKIDKEKKIILAWTLSKIGQGAGKP
jgi:hypothetical protein